MKKNNKKPKYMLGTMIALSIFLSGCARSNTDVPSVEDKKEEVRGNCEVRECIKQIETSNSVEEINEVIGFEAEKSDYSENYTWKLSEKNWITLDMSSTSPILQATIDKSTIMDENNDFSDFSNIKKELESGKSVTYDDLVKRVGGVEGTLAGKTTSSNRYIWVNKNEQTFSATISNKGKNKGKCTIISLR